jgi:hypothetical protein
MDQESSIEDDVQEVEQAIMVDQDYDRSYIPEIPFLSEKEASAGNRAGNHASSAEALALEKPRTVDRDESKLTEGRVSIQVKTSLHLRS